MAFQVVLKKAKKPMMALLILCLPAVVLYWLVPFFSGLTIGNDYGKYPFSQQMELMYSLVKGTFPLFVPEFAGGRSAAALTTGQMYHPLSHIAALTPGYWDGYALSLNTLYRLLSLGMTHVAIFFLFRALSLGRIAAFVISFVTVYNLRMLDFFRYGAALENYTAKLMLFAAMGFMYLYPRRIAPFAAMVAATYLLYCGGHPQVMFLGVLGSAMACLSIPFAFAAIDCTKSAAAKDVLRFYGLTLLAALIGTLLASMYIGTFYFEFVADNALRVGRSYEWSLVYGDTLGGTLNSFFAPLDADVHGAFGSSAIIVIPLFIALLPLVRIFPPTIIWVLWAMIVMVFMSLLGKATPVHRLFWEYVPLADSFRVPGRLSVLLPVPLALVLAWMLRSGEALVSWRGKTLPFSIMTIPAFAALLLFLGFNRFAGNFLPPPGYYHPANITEVPEWVKPLIFNLSAGALAAMVLFSVRIPWRRAMWRTLAGTVLLLLVVFQGAVQMRHATWTTPTTPSKTIDQFNAEKMNSPGFRGAPGFGMESPAITRHMASAAPEPKLARFYRKVIPANSVEDAYRKMATTRTPDAIVVEGWVKGQSSAPGNAKGIDEISLFTANFNRLVFVVTVQSDGFLSMAWPNDGRWKATLDGNPVRVYRANGIENAVRVPAGNHTVEYRYESRVTQVAAMIITGVLVLISLAFAHYYFRGLPRVVIALLLIASSIGLHAAWNKRLYGGEHLGTVYHWTSLEHPPAGNVAYGRPTRMSSTLASQTPYFYYSGQAVNGTPTGRMAAAAPTDRNPWWQVDLGTVRRLGKMRIFDGGRSRAGMPLAISVSSNGKRFFPVRQITERNEREPWTIPLDGVSARFVRLQTHRPSTLSLYEVEIYETDDRPETKVEQENSGRHHTDPDV